MSKYAKLCKSKPCVSDKLTIIENCNLLCPPPLSYDRRKTIAPVIIQYHIISHATVYNSRNTMDRYNQR